MDHHNYIFWIMHDLNYDLIGATDLFKDQLIRSDFDAGNPHFHAKFRVCATSAIISLSKFAEFRSAKIFSASINSFPPDLVGRINKLYHEIGERKIYKFRSSYAVHILDDDSKMPLKKSDGEQRFERIVGNSLGDYIEFFKWIKPDHSNSHDKSCDHSSGKYEPVLPLIEDVRLYCGDILGSNIIRL